MGWRRGDSKGRAAHIVFAEIKRDEKIAKRQQPAA
jgi:hypothetical protein